MRVARLFLATSAIGLALASFPAKAIPVVYAGAAGINFTPSETIVSPDELTLIVGFQAISGANAHLISISGTLTLSAGDGDTKSFTISTLTGSDSFTFDYSVPGIYTPSYSFVGTYNEVANTGYTVPSPESLSNQANFAEFSIASPVPEPSTWAMMILGFVGIGAMTYRRRKSALLAA
jgi:hypothetical protein